MEEKAKWREKPLTWRKNREISIEEEKTLILEGKTVRKFENLNILRGINGEED